MNTNFKRVIAYMIDMFLVSAIVFCLTNIKQVNFQLDGYNKVYNESSKVIKKYDKLKDDYDTAKKDYDKKKISKKEYNKKKDAYNDYKDTYTKKIKVFNYRVSKNSVISTIISIAVIFAYFGIFQFSMGGQTLGKKLMHLKVVSNKDKDLNVLNYLIRCTILNGVIFSIAMLICVGTLNAVNFYTANYIISNLQSIVEIIILLTVFMSNEGRGLHDLIAQTRVIEIDKDGNKIEYIPKVKTSDK